MLKNCDGCLYELKAAYEYQKEGLCLATSIDFPTSYPDTKGNHFGMIIVDDKGKGVVL